VYFLASLIVWFLVWTLYSYLIHVLAHTKFKYNFLKKLHKKHHAYDYGGSKWPPWHDYFFYFGTWQGTLDVWITFTFPILIIMLFNLEVGLCLLVFHYFYEVFLSRNILDHNPGIRGKLTKFIPIGEYHLSHHRNIKCNYSFFITLWDYVFFTEESLASKKRGVGKVL